MGRQASLPGCGGASGVAPGTRWGVGRRSWDAVGRRTSLPGRGGASVASITSHVGSSIPFSEVYTLPLSEVYTLPFSEVYTSSFLPAPLIRQKLSFLPALLIRQKH